MQKSGQTRTIENISELYVKEELSIVHKIKLKDK